MLAGLRQLPKAELWLRREEAGLVGWHTPSPRPTPALLLPRQPVRLWHPSSTPPGRGGEFSPCRLLCSPGREGRGEEEVFLEEVTFISKTPTGTGITGLSKQSLLWSQWRWRERTPGAEETLSTPGYEPHGQGQHRSVGQSTDSGSLAAWVGTQLCLSLAV